MATERRLSPGDAMALVVVVSLVLWRVLMALVVALIVWFRPAQAGPARGPEAPPPLFTLQPINGLCGSLWDHMRLLTAAGFEETWRGSYSFTVDASARLYINGEGYWLLLLTMPGDIGCLIAEGPRFDYVGGEQ